MLIKIYVTSVPQVFAMMVDVEEEEDWSLQDEVESEDEERYVSHGNQHMSHLSALLWFS